MDVAVCLLQILNSVTANLNCTQCSKHVVTLEKTPVLHAKKLNVPLCHLLCCIDRKSEL